MFDGGSEKVFIYLDFVSEKRHHSLLSAYLILMYIDFTRKYIIAQWEKNSR